MLPDIHRATQKFYIFLIVYLTGCTPMLSFAVRLSLPAATQNLLHFNHLPLQPMDNLLLQPGDIGL